jgi:hypothetical protein
MIGKEKSIDNQQSSIINPKDVTSEFENGF